MSLAVCDALLAGEGNFENLSALAVRSMQKLGRDYPGYGYGLRFNQWLTSENPRPYGSWGNGAAMRVSGCGYVARSLDEARSLSHAVTCVTHDPPEGLKGAEATAVAVFLARSGSSLKQIREHVRTHYYPIDFTLDEIRDQYYFNESCQETVPQAMEAFFESVTFEDAIRNAISIGGDSDTLAAITGAVAGAYYGVPQNIRNQAEALLDERLLGILRAFERRYP
jgi:type I restriction enzyme M protein